MGWRDQAELLLPHYPQMTSAALGSAGHNTHLDRPAQAHALLGAWLDELADHGWPTTQPGRDSSRCLGRL
ncbi:hypothetical protein [Streptomyces sp. YGL11-2]|uniref:hypothetical protein n=1 Tax=Streptomyces sp. YGL11-2 TaxID=3414028 RepID=UPI003CEA111E